MKFIRLCIILLITLNLYAQKLNFLTEKQFHELQLKFRFLANSNVDSAFIITNEIELSNNYKHKAFAAGAKSYLFQVQTKPDTLLSNDYYLLATKFLTKVKESKEKDELNANLLNIGGLNDWKRNHLTNALSKFEKGLKLAIQNKDISQYVKINMNMALVYIDLDHYKLAISSLKQSDKIIVINEPSLLNDMFNYHKSNVNFNLGKAYEKYYSANGNKVELIDSAKYYYQKAIIYSKELLDTKANSKIGLANAYCAQKDYLNAEKAFIDILNFCKKNNLNDIYNQVFYSLGFVYYNKKEYDKSLFYLKKGDSIYHSDKSNSGYFMYSNYFQAKINSTLDNKQASSKYSKIYLENLEKNELLLNDQINQFNFRFSENQMEIEMNKIQTETKNTLFWINLGKASIIFLIVSLLFLSYYNVKKRKKVEQNVIDIIEKYKNTDSAIGIVQIKPINETDNPLSTNLNRMSSEKENEILEKLKVLENSKYFLKQEFTQQAVAKKIKTNTTYLSLVVNKYYKKTFSEYSNELRINYAIKEMINNPTFRMYSTQGIAESVGFKSAGSFKISFNKRTGVTPAQFIKKIIQNRNN